MRTYSETVSRLPESALPQHYSDLVHAGVIVVITFCATVLTVIVLLSTVARDSVARDIVLGTVGNVYTAGIGYAAGRSGSVAHRVFSTRRGGQVDATE